MRRSLLLLAALAASAHAQRNNPFAPPNAKIQVAPISGYDLQHVAVTLDVDYANRTFKGEVTNRIAPLTNGMTELKLHAGESLVIDSVAVDGKETTHRHDGQDLIVGASGLTKGKPVNVTVKYHTQKTKDAVSFGGGGWHWIEPNGIDPKHVGFWTQGETEYNREWAPTWDYPNDFATTETRVTVAKGWTVIGNGRLVEQKDSGARTTFHWKQDQPHVTYLMSLAAGPLDIKKDKWRNVELWYVTPGGKGNLIQPSFGDTADMLSFFAGVLGVDYPWVKYAQNAMIDFGGGMENISSTHLGADSLTDGKDGFRTMSSLNAHELAHQWFGDLVTCKDWGHIWLNESFATFMQWAYFEHAQGINGYLREVNAGIGEYLGESRQYRRPLATNLYPDADSMFDSHSYPKGGAVLHTLRRQIGDAAFYKGLKNYLTKHRHQPVDSTDLLKAMSESAGQNLQAFWDQWIYKPGHPVLAYDWNWADDKLTLAVRQTQDTTNGTPIYKIKAKFATIQAGQVRMHSIDLDSAENKVTIDLPKPDAVILDPNLDFLREMDHRFLASELAAIAEFAPSPIDRASALAAMLRADDPDYGFAVRLLDNDMGQFPIFPSMGSMIRAATKIPVSFWKAQAKHPDYNRRAEAVRSLAAIKDSAEAKEILRGMIADDQPTFAVVFALGGLDPVQDKALFLKAAGIASLRSEIKSTAFQELAKSGASEVWPLIYAAGASEDEDLVGAAVRALAFAEPSAQTRTVLNRALASNSSGLKRVAIQTLATKPDASLRDAIVKVSEDASVPRDVRENAKKLIAQ